MNLKKTIATLAATLLLYAGNPCQSKAYRPVPGRTLETYIEEKAKNNTPARVRTFFLKSIKYAADCPGKFVDYKGKRRQLINDYMQDPVDTYLRGKGDCEDYAELAHNWLTACGYETKVIAFFEKNKNSGHAICAVKENGRWAYLGNDAYSKWYNSISELVARNEPDWAVYFELVQDETRKTGDKIINPVYRDEKQKKLWKSYVESNM